MEKAKVTFLVLGTGNVSKSTAYMDFYSQKGSMPDLELHFYIERYFSWKGNKKIPTARYLFFSVSFFSYFFRIKIFP